MYFDLCLRKFYTVRKERRRMLVTCLQMSLHLHFQVLYFIIIIILYKLYICCIRSTNMWTFGACSMLGLRQSSGPPSSPCAPMVATIWIKSCAHRRTSDCCACQPTSNRPWTKGCYRKKKKCWWQYAGTIRLIFLSRKHHSIQFFFQYQVSVYANAREVVATYTVDEARMELVITLPVNHPLGSVHVECRQQIGGTAQWRNWVMQLTVFLTHQVNLLLLK